MTWAIVGRFARIRHPSVLALLNLYPAHMALRFDPHQIYRQQPIQQRRRPDLDPVGQHETSLELPCRDSAMKILAALVISLFAANSQFIVLEHHVELISREPGDRQGDAQGLDPAIFPDHALDVIGRIPIPRRLPDPIDQTLNLLEPDQERI